MFPDDDASRVQQMVSFLATLDNVGTILIDSSPEPIPGALRSIKLIQFAPPIPSRVYSLILRPVAEFALISMPPAKEIPAPHMPFRLFLDAIDMLVYRIPSQIKCTIWHNSPGMRPEEVLDALRFFELIDEDGLPSAVLRNFISFPQRRGECMRSLLLNAYRNLKDRDLMKMTPRVLEDAMECYDLAESDRQGAVAFFLHAAKYAGVPVSKMLLSWVRNTGPRGKRSRVGRAGSAVNGMWDVKGGGPKTLNRVQLRSGGAVTVIVDADVFTMNEEDRVFVFELVDKIQEYEKHDSPPRASV